MLTLDYSGVAIAAILGFDRKVSGSEEDISNMIHHVILSSIRQYRKKFKEYASETVIAVDCGSWRKDVFPGYKYKRKKSKEESDIPWDIIYKYMDEVLDALDKFFPYKVIRVSKAEADDVMAVMAMDVCPQLVTTVGFEESVEELMIVSSDKDMAQLMKFPYVKQFRPYQQKLMSFEPGTNAKSFLKELVIRGDAGDGVPNVFSPIDSFVTGTRQTAAREKLMKPLMESKFLIDGTDDPVIKKRIMENSRLINFDFIPHEIRTAIVECYNKEHTGSKLMAYEWMASKDMKLLMADIEDF